MVAVGKPVASVASTTDGNGKAIAHLDYALEEAMSAVRGTTGSVILRGNPYAGKTLAQERVRKALGLSADEIPHNEITKKVLTDEEAKKLKDDLSKGIVLEGSLYQIDYILRGEPLDDRSSDKAGMSERIAKWYKKNLDDRSSDKAGISKRIAKWYKRKVGKEDDLPLPPNVAAVDAWLSKDDAFTLFDYFAETIENEHPNSQVHTKSELTKKRDRLISLASWGGAPTNEQKKGGMLLPPLLRECMEKYAAKSDSELEQMEGIERTREQLMASFFGFTALEAGINTVNFMSVAKEVATTLVAASPIFSLAGIVLSSSSAILGFYKDGKAAGYSKYIEAYKSWNDLSKEKRRLLGEKLDEQNHLAPGSSFAFLDGWLGGSKNEREAESVFISKLETTFTDPFIDKLRSAVNQLSDVKKKLEEDSTKIDGLIASLERMEQEIEKLREDLYASGTRRIRSEDELKAWLGILSEERTKSLVGLRSSDADKEVQGIVRSIIEDAEERTVVVAGEPGAGKTTTMFLAASTILSSGKKLYFIEYPANFNPGRFRELQRAYAIVDFNHPEPAVEFFSKTMRPEGLIERDFDHIIISVRDGFLGPDERIEVQDEVKFSYKRLKLSDRVLDEVAGRAISASLAELSAGDARHIADVLVKKSEAHPLYITEAIKLIVDRMRGLGKYDEKMLDDLPGGIKDLVVDILKQEERRDPNLLIIYYLVSHSRGCPREYLEAFNQIYGIKEPRFLDEAPNGRLSLHFWYRDMIQYVNENGPRKGMVSFNSETMLGSYLRDLDDSLARKKNDIPPVLLKSFNEFKKHKASVKFVDLADLVMLGATIYLADSMLIWADGSGYGFNILEERINYNNLKTESVPSYGLILGFLIDGYLGSESSAISKATEIRPFYCLHAIYASRLLRNDLANRVETEFIEGEAKGISIDDLLEAAVDKSAQSHEYTSVISSTLERLKYLQINGNRERAMLDYCELNYEKAIIEGRKAISEEPINPELYRLIGISYYELTRYEDAIKEIDMGLSLAPHDANLHNGKGSALFNLHRYEDAIEELRAAIKLSPGKAKFYDNLGTILYMLQRNEEAIREYDRAIDLNPNNADYHENKACALLELQKYEDVIKECDVATALAPNAAEAHHKKGFALHALKRYEGAVKEYELAIGLNPADVVDVHYNLGNVLRDLERYEDAIKQYDIAIALEPNEHQYYNIRGRALNSLGRFDEAISSFNEAIKLKVDDPFYYMDRGLAYYRLGKNRPAIDDIDVAIRLDSKEPYYHFAKSLFLNAEWRFDEALKEINIAIQLKPDEEAFQDAKQSVLDEKAKVDVPMESMMNALDEVTNPKVHALTHGLKGTTLAFYGHFEEAIEEFDIALKLDPDEITSRRGKADALLNSHKYDLAIEEYDRVLQQDTSNPSDYYNKGFALYSLNNPEEAIIEFDHAIEMKKDDDICHYYKALALKSLGRFEEALEEFNLAIKLNSEAPYYHLMMGVTMYELGMVEQAIKEMDTSTSLAPGVPDIRMIKGFHLNEMDRNDDALNEFNIGIRLSPDAHLLHYGRGLVLQKLGKHDDALKEFDKSIELDHDTHGGCYVHKGEILQIMGNLTDAITLLDRGISISPDDQDLLIDYSVCMTLMNIEDKGLEKLTEAIGRRPSIKEKLFDRARSKIESEKTDPKAKNMLIRFLDRHSH